VLRRRGGVHRQPAAGRVAPAGDALPLPFRPPLDGAGLLAFLSARTVPGVEEAAGGAFRRSLRLPRGAGTVELTCGAGEVRARFALDDERDLEAAVARTRALLDLDADPRAIDAVLGADALLGPLVRATPGRRVPGTVDGHELAVRAVLGQQVSLAGAATLAARLVAAHGEPLARPLGGVTHLFPTAAALAGADAATLAMPASRRRALVGLAGALAAGEIVLDGRAARDDASRRLLALPGIGPWTVAYVRMRALHDRDAFPASDLGVRHALGRLGVDGRPAEALRVAERWRPFRAYAVQHLWASLAAEKARSRVVRTP
jgi:AraC family transcriptional regulator, regulatory protein of adaptative response / DNA-3-methyladenine glycosylase II